MDFPQVVALIEGVDVVVHLAVVAGVNYENRAEPGPTEVDSSDEAVLRVNPTSAYHVFEAARRAGVRRVVYASSLTIQLADLNRPDFRESSYPAPSNLYACTKLFGESLASVYQHQYGMEMISLRIGQPFPVGTKTDDVWRHSLRARSLSVTMEDVGRAVEAGVFADVPGGIFNVVSGSDNPGMDLTAARRDPSVNAFRLHYENGLIVTHFHQVESVRRWCLAARVSDTGEMVAGAGNVGGAAHYFPHFARLCREIDDFFVTGQSPVPLKRIYTTSMVTALCLRALAATDGRLSTPELQGRAEFFNH